MLMLLPAILLLLLLLLPLLLLLLLVLCHEPHVTSVTGVSTRVRAAFFFIFNIFQPLASLLGDFTEEVSAHTNQTLGGLIQATLGNAVEIVVAIQALYANQIRVVQVIFPLLGVGGPR